MKARAVYSVHSLCTGFVAYAHTRGASDRAIAHQTRHGFLAPVGTYVRLHTPLQRRRHPTRPLIRQSCWQV